MTNIELYINYNNIKVPCLEENKQLTNPSIDASNVSIPKRMSKYLLYDNFLSEYDTDEEKNLVMLNILLLDNVPTEDSTKLLNSGTIYKIDKENRQKYNLIISLIDSLQINKADKTELFSKLYRDLIGVPQNLSDFNNDLHLVSDDDISSNYYNKQQINLILSDLIGSIDFSDFALKSELFSKSYNDLKDKPFIPSKVSDLNNDSNYVDLLFVIDKINLLIGEAPETLDTLKEISDFILNDNNNLNLLSRAINTKADSSSLIQLSQIVQQLQDKLILLKENSTNHIFLTLDMYDNLQEYDKNTLYFIVELVPTEKSYWRLGDGLPIILSESWKFGDGLPIILS